MKTLMLALAALAIGAGAANAAGAAVYDKSMSPQSIAVDRAVKAEIARYGTPVDVTSDTYIRVSVAARATLLSSGGQ